MYVDDIIITGDCSEEISNAKKLLANKFEVKDLGIPQVLPWDGSSSLKKGNFCFSTEVYLGLTKRDMNDWV